MQKHDLPELSTRLSQIADALGGRTPPPAGLFVWLDALAEFPMPVILHVLTEWAKANSKMPTPADIVKRCRERQSETREAAARAHAASARSDANPFALRGDPNNPAYRAYLAAVADYRRSQAGVRDPKAWAKRLREREEAGEVLSEIQRSAWRAALDRSAELAA